MKCTYTVSCLLTVASLGLATIAFSEPLDERDFTTKFRKEASCPRTREEIAKLKQCIQCPREDDDHITKVCCPPNERFEGAKGGCLITEDDFVCRTRRNARDRKICYETIVLPVWPNPSPGDSNQSQQVPQVPPSPVNPPVFPAPDPSFDRCLRACREAQNYLPIDIIGCRNACGPNASNPPESNYQTGGCIGLRRYCASLIGGYLSCQKLYRSLCN